MTNRYGFQDEVYETADRIGVQIPETVRLFDFPEVDYYDEGTFFDGARVRRIERCAAKYLSDRCYSASEYRAGFGRPGWISHVKRASRRAQRRLSRAIARDALRDG